MDKMYSPCPGSRSYFGNEQYDSWNDDALDTFEYTAAIDFPSEPHAHSLARSKPRRALKTSSFAIHEDSKSNTTGESPRATQSSLKRKTQDGGSSILAQPAQRFQRQRVNFAEGLNNTSSHLKRTIDSAAKRDSKGNDFQKENMPRVNQKFPGDNGLKKDVRRRTVYIPEEDTAVPTVFMNLFSPLKSTGININNATVPSDDTVPIYSLEERIAAKKSIRTSSVEKLRQSPLQQSRKVTQQLSTVRDVVGKNGGKENIPPGYSIEEKKFMGKNYITRFSQDTPKEPLKNVSRQTQSLKTNITQTKQRGKSKSNPMSETSSTVQMTKAGMNTMKASLSAKQGAKKNSVKSSISSLRSQVSRESLSVSKRQAIPTQLSVPKTRLMNIDHQYPRFSDEISNPAMYEDNWLTHQEVVITQLVNGLCDSKGGKRHVQDSEALRHEIIHIYQSDAFLLLYKRLQASIWYGALAPPKDILRRGSRLADDLGMKKSFLDFWSDTYDLHALKAAAETVVGRRIVIQSTQTNDRSSNPLVKQHKALKRAIEAFFEAFLIRNMDKDEKGDTKDNFQEDLYRRTLLRSVMIIVLLDKARLTPGNSLPQCLFIDSSPIKSSPIALQALANLLLPSMGDINRQVKHLDCHLSYKQHQLQNYEFRIHNLAVDLRDGVILTRLVEVLLLPNASCLHARNESIGPSSLMSPTSVLADETTEYPLSKNLKYPCASRAAKVFNVNIALDALKQVKGIGGIANELSAEHIVDGYREKTIALLWLLVGKWGLAEILDWDDVRNEVLRLQKKLALSQGLQGRKARHPEDLHESHEDLLIEWASTLAQLKGLRFINTTTSFADGKIFDSIICEYESFLQDQHNGSRESVTDELSKKLQPAADEGSLKSRLQALGCSSQFASLVAESTSVSRLFDRDFVLGALTFLCSRLLSPSKRPRAAVVIQKAWRRVLARRSITSQLRAKYIAEQCAAIVCARERVLWAKIVILKWWRERQKKKSKAVCPRSRNAATTSRRPPNLLEKRRKRL